ALESVLSTAKKDINRQPPRGPWSFNMRTIPEFSGAVSCIAADLTREPQTWRTGATRSGAFASRHLRRGGCVAPADAKTLQFARKDGYDLKEGLCAPGTTKTAARTWKSVAIVAGNRPARLPRVRGNRPRLTTAVATARQGCVLTRGT